MTGRYGRSSGPVRSRRASAVRLVTASFGNARYRWWLTVRGLMNSWAAMSRLVAPEAASRTTWSSCGVSRLSRSGAGARAAAGSPAARSSARARSAQGAAPVRSKSASAVRRWARASVTRRAESHGRLDLVRREQDRLDIVPERSGRGHLEPVERRAVPAQAEVEQAQRPFRHGADVRDLLGGELAQRAGG